MVVTVDKWGDKRVGALLKVEAQIRGEDGRLHPAEDLEWKVRQPALARMEDNGYLRLLAEGTVTVEARAGRAVGTADVTITSVGPIMMMPDTSVVVAGSQRRLYARIWAGMGPGDYGWKAGELTWTTSDPRLATVSSAGVVTGVAPGRVIVTAAGRGTSGTAVVDVVAGAAYQQISAGSWHTCGAATDGRTLCWGSNYNFALGTKTAPVSCSQYGCIPTPATAPLQIDPELRFEQVTVSSNGSFAHSCALDPTGKAYCWGTNYEWQGGVIDHRTCSNGSLSHIRCLIRPTAVATASLFKRIAAGAGYTCALSMEGEPHCWGSNGHGQSGAQRAEAVPAKVVGVARLVDLSVGVRHACGIDAEGLAYCWGNNRAAELGLGAADTLKHPGFMEPAASDLRFRQIVAGDAITCGVTHSGEAYCWGGNRELLSVDQPCPGMGGATLCAPRPQPVAPQQRFISLALGSSHACGISTSGSLYCWGQNDKGQLGSGGGAASVSSGSPAEVTGGKRWRFISAAGTSTCGIAESGVAYCWGSGPIGDGGQDPSGIPVRVLGQLSTG